MTRTMTNMTFSPNSTIPRGGKLIAVSDIRPTRSNQSRVVPGMTITGKGLILEMKNKETFRHRNGYSQVDGITHFSGQFSQRRKEFPPPKYFVSYTNSAEANQSWMSGTYGSNHGLYGIYSQEEDLRLESDKRAFAHEELAPDENLIRRSPPEVHTVYDYLFDRHLRTLMNLPTVNEEPEEEEEEGEDEIEESGSLDESEKLSIIGDNLVHESINDIIKLLDDKSVSRIVFQA